MAIAKRSVHPANFLRHLLSHLRVRLASTGFRSTSTSFHSLLLLLLVFSTLQASGCASWTRVAYATRKTCFAVVHRDREGEREKVTWCRGEIGVGCRRVCRIRTSKLESLQRLDWKKLSNQGVKSRRWIGARSVAGTREWEEDGEWSEKRTERRRKVDASPRDAGVSFDRASQEESFHAISSCTRIFNLSRSFIFTLLPSSVLMNEHKRTLRESRYPVRIIGEFVLPTHFLATRTRKSE